MAKFRLHAGFDQIYGPTGKIGFLARAAIAFWLAGARRLDANVNCGSGRR
jgi:hypothetical protein